MIKIFQCLKQPIKTNNSKTEKFHYGIIDNFEKWKIIIIL